MWESDFSLAEKLTDYHGLRYFLVLPLFQLGKWLGVSYDWLFSISIPGLIYLTSYFVNRSIRKIDRQISLQRKVIIFIGISLVFVTLSFFMNGRLMLVFAGSSMLMWSLLTWDDNHDSVNFLAVVAAIFFCSVSSGTFLVSIFIFYFFLAVNIAITNPSVCRMKVLLTYAGLLVLLTPYITMLVIKNLDFFGEGPEAIFNMLHHGYGFIVFSFDKLVGGALFFISLSLGYIFRKLIYRNWVLVSFMLFALAGGMFGFSTGLLIVPPLLVVGNLAIVKICSRIEALRPKESAQMR
ncbi:MAG: hypothetical protein ACR2QW_16660 [bacterium]